jgi:hypothetical protein
VVPRTAIAMWDQATAAPWALSDVLEVATALLVLYAGEEPDWPAELRALGADSDPICSNRHRVMLPCWGRRRRTMHTSRDIILVEFFAILLALTIVLVYLGPLTGQPWAQTMQWLQVILPVETVLLGSTVGFYFANRR